MRPLAPSGALIGAWHGFTAVSDLFAVVTTIVGAAITCNLFLIVHDIMIDSSRSLSSIPSV